MIVLPLPQYVCGVNDEGRRPLRSYLIFSYLFGGKSGYVVNFPLASEPLLQVLNGTKSPADLNINENLLSRWKQQLLTHAAPIITLQSSATER
jgi:hypothetical protein